MVKHAIAFSMALMASITTLAAPLQWICDWPEAKSQTFSLYQGETATFEPTFRVNGRTVTNATIEAVWYQTNGMTNAWWKLDGATFAPSNDVGAASYRFFVEAKASGDTIYRANGALRMLPSPGFTPNAIEPPIVTLDFSTIEVANAPYYDKAETEAKIVELAPAPGNYAAVSNAAMTALQSYTETDPTVPAWAKAETQPLPPNYSTISNKAMTALQEHQSLANYYNKTETESKIVELAPAASTTPPQMAGTASPGSASAYARGDHAHPAETALGYTPGQAYFPAGFFPCTIYDHTDSWTWDSVDSNSVPSDTALSTLGPLSLQDTTYQSQAVIGLFSGNTELAFFDKDSGALLGVAEPYYTDISRDEIGIGPPVLSSVSVRGVEVAMRSVVEVHTSNTTIHVTAEDKASWNGKQDKLPYPTNAIPYAALVGAPAPSGMVSETSVLTRPASGDGVSLAIPTGGTLSANIDISGQCVFAYVTPSVPYTVDSGLTLVGYGSWPTNAFQAVFWRVGAAHYCKIIRED